MTAPTTRADHAERSPSVAEVVESKMPPHVSADHVELAACPFCGGAATIERFGNTRVSTQYHCDDCGCFLETGEEFHHGRAWNRRHREDALLSEIAALRGDLAKTGRDYSELRDSFDAVSNKLCVERAHGSRQSVRATQAERQRDELRKALETIGEMAPSTCETSLAHDMAQFASQALANQGADQ